MTTKKPIDIVTCKVIQDPEDKTFTLLLEWYDPEDYLWIIESQGYTDRNVAEQKLRFIRDSMMARIINPH